MNWSLYREILSMELRKVFAYRSFFWVNFVFSAAGRLGIAYFLWKAVFALNPSGQVGGMSFQEVLIYFMCAYFMDQIVRSAAMRFGLISREIYDGTLTRYLLYPANVMDFKLSYLAVQSIVGIVQMGLGFVVFAFIFGGWPDAPVLSPVSVLMGLLYAVPAALLFFTMAYALELTAFWADNVWSLLVMLRFISAFLGGNFVPMSMFPETWQPLIYSLPFYHLIGGPSEAMMGRLSAAQLLQGIGVCLAWTIVMFLLIHFVWRRGLKQFTGVGI